MAKLSSALKEDTDKYKKRSKDLYRQVGPECWK
jgi:hypothetical protein